MPAKILVLMPWVGGTQDDIFKTVSAANAGIVVLATIATAEKFGKLGHDVLGLPLFINK